MEAAVIMMKCPTANKQYAVRIQKTLDGDWCRTWAFKISPKRAQVEGYDQTPITGSLSAERSFPGCPHCGKTGFMQCGLCGRLSCWDGVEGIATCAWCGSSSDIHLANSFDVDGRAF